MNPVALSVIVPTRNRHEQLTHCLRALAAVDAPEGGFEVIVVNDGGEPVPTSLLEELSSSLVVHAIDQPRKGPGAARNAGAGAARGTLLAFTDDDCEALPRWLRALELRLATDPNWLVGGDVVSTYPDNVWASASQQLIDHLHRWYNRDPLHAHFVTSNNLAMSAETFRALGGFHLGFPDAAAEDRELAERARRAGRELVHAPEAVVRHRHRLSGRAFLRQHYGYGRGAYRLLRIRRQRGGGMVYESPRFYTELLRAPLRQPGGREGLRLMLLLAVSQVAHTAGFLREAVSQSGRHGEA